MVSHILLNFGNTFKGVLSHLCLLCQDLFKKKKSLFRVPLGVASILLAFGSILKNKTAVALTGLTQWGESIEVPTVKLCTAPPVHMLSGHWKSYVGYFPPHPIFSLDCL